MKYIASFAKETTCERCGRGIKNVVIFLNNEGVRVEVGIDCAAIVMGKKQNVVSRWIKDEQYKIDMARNNLAQEGLGAEITAKGNIRFWRKEIGKEFGSFYYSMDFIKLHFPEVLTKYAI